MHRLAVAALAGLCVSCGQLDLGVKIPFAATWQGASIDCEGGDPALTDLRFYVNAVQLIDTAGRAHDVRYATEFGWQNDAVAIIDLEDGSGACINGNSDVFSYLIGAVPKREYRGLRFTIGVPFRLNHDDPLTAMPPLGDADMHRDRRSGYKFLRAGIATTSDGFWIHVGSARCDGTIEHITGCRFENRITVELPDFVPGESTVRVELAALLDGTDLGDGVSSECSSGPSETACVAPFAALGIDFLTGERSGPQRVFSVQ